MGGVLHGLLSAPPPLVYVLVGLLVFGEAAVFAGFVLPGETAVVLGGVIASRHGIDLRVLIVLVVALRDHRRHAWGTRWAGLSGDRVLRLRPLRRHEERLDRRPGVPARPRRVRRLPRPVDRLPAGRHAGPGGRQPHAVPAVPVLERASAASPGASTFCLVGYLAGNSYEVVRRRIGIWGAVATVVLVVGLVVVLHLRRRRAGRARRATAMPAAGSLSRGRAGRRTPATSR